MQSAAGLDSNNLRPRLLLPLAYLLNCPRGVFRDQWLRVGGRAFERRKVGWNAHIAQSDTQLRKNPRRFIRLIGDSLKSARNSASVKSKYSCNDMPVVDRRAQNALSRDS